MSVLILREIQMSRVVGRLRFLDPAAGSGSAFFAFVARVVPEIRAIAGLMVLFPRYVPHLVHPYRGNRQRISLAFNLRNEPYP
jgi:Putative 2OG-Fe(II) oxygenase